MKPLVIIIWLLLGLGYFFLDKNYDEKCCDQGTSVIEEGSTSSEQLSAAEAASNANNADAHEGMSASEKGSSKLQAPLGFLFGGDSCLINDNFSSYRDSILANLKDNQKLEIIGHYGKGETNPSKFENLGIARAEATKNLFKSSVDGDRILTSARLVEIGDNADGWMAGVDYEYRVITEKIKEIDDRTLIYFPYNSTQKLADAEVEKYLNDVAERVNATGETVQLTGHTDSFGNADYNYKLGVNRAKIIRSYLMSKGVKSARISVESMGESNPIAPNTSKSSRAKNRRVELVIK